MQQSHAIRPDPTDISARTTRLAFILRYVLPVAAFGLIALIAAGAVAFVAVRVVLGALVLLVAVVAIAGGLWQAYAVRRDRTAFPATGLFSDAGGFRLHLLVMGKETDKPTVILEGGMASFAANWHWVQTELAKETRVVAYDRAGFGWSDVSPNPRDAQSCARELHTALINAGLPGPYVLAGWSFGGLVVRAFTDLYPKEVVGLVLVDASHPDQWVHMPVANADRMLAVAMRIQAELCRFGFGRAVKAAGKLLGEGLPEREAKAIVAWCALRNCYFTESAQARRWSDVSRPQINNARPLDNLPVYLLGVGNQPMYGEELTRLQEDLATISSNAQRTIVQDATHESLVGKAANAAHITHAVRQVLQAAQSGSPLAA